MYRGEVIAMQTNNRKKKSEPALDNIPVSQAASLEVISGLFATLAEGLGTFAAALAIQEAQQQTTASNADLQKIHEQLHYLTKEVKKISRALNI